MALFVVVVGLTRLIPHPPNFTPVLAVALFAGAKSRSPFWAVGLPVLAMLLGDLFLGFHLSMVATYSALVVIALFGRAWFKKGPSSGVLKVVAGSFSAALLFFVITNFFVWATSGLYVKSAEGLVQCYVAALPFFNQSMISTLLYASGMFAVWSLAEKAWPELFLVPQRLVTDQK